MLSLRHVVACTDFGPSSLRALELAVDLATKYEARLTLFHATEIPVTAYPMVPAVVTQDLIDAYTHAAEAAMQAQLDSMKPQFPALETVMRRGDPAHALLDFVAEAKAGIVVIGSHGHRGVSRLLLGSVAEKVIRLSTVPVLVVRGES